MRKELSPAITALIGVAAAVLIVGLGFMFYQRASGSSAEDPELARKQWEVERARTPNSAPVAAPDGTSPGSYSPGREGEMAARAKSGG